MHSAEQRVKHAASEEVQIVPYDPAWPAQFREEARHLRAILPAELIGRIEHFGSTAIPGLAAKPIVDMLVEVRSLQDVRDRIAPILEAGGYEFFWRPSWRDGITPEYTWFIKRDAAGTRTHHVHMLTADSPDWERLLFRDYLIAHPDTAREYEELKRRIVASAPAADRIAYAQAKTDFITRITALARAQREPV